jgi:hypothetical protein
MPATRPTASVKAWKPRRWPVPWPHCAAHEYCLFIACGVSGPGKSAWLAGRLRKGATASASQYVRRFRLRGKTGKTAFKAALSIIHT